MRLDAKGRQIYAGYGTGVTRRDYVGEFLYEDGVLKMILFDGGYVRVSGSIRTYMFFLSVIQLEAG